MIQQPLPLPEPPEPKWLADLKVFRALDEAIVAMREIEASGFLQTCTLDEARAVYEIAKRIELYSAEINIESLAALGRLLS